LGAPSDALLYEVLRVQLPAEAQTRFHIHCGQFNLLESMAFLQRMALVVGVDSGTLHMASATGVPVVALFGPMDERQWAPVNATIVTEPVACRPCSLSTPCRYDFQCMTHLQPEAVIETIRTYAGFA
jgi:ADP-heptose:LPS heptosyltransferase